MFGANLQRGIAGDLYGMGSDRANLMMGLGDRQAGQARDTTGLGERQAGFTQGIARDLGGLSQQQFGNATQERDAARSDEFGRFGANLSGLGALSGLQQQQRGFEANNRQELRGERDYQGTMAEQARRNAIEQQQFNEWLRNSGWNRGVQAGGLGFGNDPSGALSGAAGNAQNRANDLYSMIGGLGQSFGGRG
jgi:hypothetical protein